MCFDRMPELVKLCSDTYALLSGFLEPTIISKELRKGRKPNVFRHNVVTYAFLYVDHQADSSLHSAQ